VKLNFAHYALFSGAALNVLPGTGPLVSQDGPTYLPWKACRLAACVG
jgi:hypothetical protein